MARILCVNTATVQEVALMDGNEDSTKTALTQYYLTHQQ